MHLAFESKPAQTAPVTGLVALTASIAHEVSQPLSGIVVNASTCLRMLAADPPDLRGARKTVGLAIRDANRAMDVLIRLRTLFAKGRSQAVQFDLHEAAHEVIGQMVEELTAAHARVLLTLAGDLPLVTADRVQIQLVIRNLLVNAIEAMCDVDPREKWIGVSILSEAGGGVRLSVQDCGSGVCAGDLNRIFEAFYTTKETGMGMGLFICKSIIESSGGRLWATSMPGGGATVSFFLP